MSGEFVMEVEDGIVDAPERIALIGEGGIGKTTFAASSPRPFFIDLERGSRRLKHVGRNKNVIDTLQKLKEAIEWLLFAQHLYLTVVFDSLDRAEALVWKYLMDRDGVSSIEHVSKGYGRGYNDAYAEFRQIFSMLEALVEKRGMNVIILAHPKLEKLRNPSGADYDRYVFKVHAHVGNMMFEACDHVLFAHRNVVVTEQAFDEARHRAIGGDKRLLRTVGSPTYLAKTRVTIPDPIPLSWHDWVCHLASAGFPRLLRDTVRDNGRRLGDAETQKKIEGMLANGTDVNQLARANSKLLQLLGGASAMSSEHSREEESPKDGAGQPQTATTAAAAPATAPNN